MGMLIPMGDVSGLNCGKGSAGGADEELPADESAGEAGEGEERAIEEEWFAELARG
jgi:hypothetical protein